MWKIDSLIKLLCFIITIALILFAIFYYTSRSIYPEKEPLIDNLYILEQDGNVRKWTGIFVLIAISLTMYIGTINTIIN